MLHCCIDSPATVPSPPLAAAASTGDGACIIANVRLWSLGRNGVETNDVLGVLLAAAAVAALLPGRTSELDCCEMANASVKHTNAGDILDIDKM